MFNIIPAIDLLDGCAVRLTKGDYAQKTVYSTTPEITAKEFAQAGAQLIHLVDLDGAKAGKPINLDTIKKIRATVSCQLELGGGIRTVADVHKVLDLGIDRVILGSIAVKNKPLTAQLVAKFGAQIVIGVDAKNGLVATEGWLETSQTPVVPLVKEMEAMGVHHIIYTDISRDGMLQGPNTEAYKNLVPQTRVKIIASGGISGLSDIIDLKNISGLDGVVVGKALYEGRINIKELFNG